MALPRRVVPGAIYFISRCALLRQFRLTPTPQVVQILDYCLAHAAKITGMRLLAYVAMGNHHHPVVQDVWGRLPDFLHLLHMLMAKALNVHQGKSGSLWDPGGSCVVLLAEREDVLRKIAYVVANPVKAGLVRRPEDWPGPMFFRRSTITVKRPEQYFGPGFDEELELQITQPTFADDAPGEWFAQVEDAVGEQVREARATVQQSGRKFAGVKRVLRTSIEARATPAEPVGDRKPRLAAAESDARLRQIKIERGFQQAYRTALADWKSGKREKVFPYGTWWMRQHHRAEVATAPAQA